MLRAASAEFLNDSLTRSMFNDKRWSSWMSRVFLNPRFLMMVQRSTLSVTLLREVSRLLKNVEGSVRHRFSASSVVIPRTVANLFMPSPASATASLMDPKMRWREPRAHSCLMPRLDRAVA